MKNFWDDVHLTNKTVFLGHSNPDNDIQILGLSSYNFLNKNVLDIGIGTGEMANLLLTKGAIVSCLDISSIALDKVRNKILVGYLADEIEELPDNTFDLAISFLVTQHIEKNNLLKQLSNVIRSLKDDGIFALQFAFSMDSVEHEIETEELQQGGGLVRNLDTMELLVSKAGGRITWVSSKTPTFERYRSGWHFIQVKKL